MERPKVVVYGDVSVDGRLTVGPDILLLRGDPWWPGGATNQTVAYHRLMDIHRPEATMEGSNAFVASGAGPEAFPAVEGDPGDLYEDYMPKSVAERPGHRGWFVVVDGRGRVRWAFKEHEGWHLLILASREAPPEYLAFLRSQEIPYLIAGSTGVDLSEALGKLGALGVSTVLVTSPGILGGALRRQGLVDEVNLDFFPSVIGGTTTPSLFRSPELGETERPARLSLVSNETQVDGRVWVRYRVERGD